MVASDAQSKRLAPLVGYFERKRRDREEKDVADKRWGGNDLVQSRLHTLPALLYVDLLRYSADGQKCEIVR